jgi:hypothetical protein
MLKKKLLNSVLALSLLTPITLIGAPSVSASLNEDINSDVGIEILNLEDYIQTEDLSSDQAEILEYKTKNDISWDVNDPQKFKSVPEEYKTISLDEVSEGITSKEYMFEDGSIFRISIESPEVDPYVITPMSVVNYSYGSQYNQQLFTMTRGSLTASMRVTGWLARPGYGYSNITEVYQGSVNGFNISGAPSATIVRQNESSGRAALAELSWFNSKGISGTWGGVSGSFTAGRTFFMYVAFINGVIYVSDNVPI